MTRNQIELIISASRQAESDTDWQRIDEQIAQLVEVDQNMAASFALEYVADPGSKVRDTSASILSFLDIDEPDLLAHATDAMITMATSDEHVFASGRAATFLLKHQQDAGSCLEIREALAVFKDRVVINGWKKDLIDNIPNGDLANLLH